MEKSGEIGGVFLTKSAFAFINHPITLFGIEVISAAMAKKTATTASDTVTRNHLRFMSGTEIVVFIGFAMMGLGLTSVFGLIIGLLSAPDSFWSSMCDKIEKYLAILFDDKTDSNL